jgi:predicted RNA-binding Zn-ribbon protein involved in translation (DUF1610 family)
MVEQLKTCSSCKYEIRGLESDSCFDCLTEAGQEQIMTNWKPKRGKNESNRSLSKGCKDHS